MRRAVVTRLLGLAAGLLLFGCSAGARPMEAPAPTTARPPNPTAAPAELPGEPVDGQPIEGAKLAVVGVPAGDVLSVRAGPGVEFAVSFTLTPLADAGRATGRSRGLADRSRWVELNIDGRTGWVNSRYVAQAGRTTDVTAALGQSIRAGTMAELAAAVADVRHPERGGVTVVDGPRAGDLEEITVDVLGLADDAQLGDRLHVFAVRDGGAYVVRTVEATALCARGVADDGLCT